MAYLRLKLVNQAQICPNPLNRVPSPPRRATVEEVIHAESGIQLLVVGIDRTQPAIQEGRQSFIAELALRKTASTVDNRGFKANLVLQIEEGLTANFRG